MTEKTGVFVDGYELADEPGRVRIPYFNLVERTGELEVDAQACRRQDGRAVELWVRRHNPNGGDLFTTRVHSTRPVIPLDSRAEAAAGGRHAFPARSTSTVRYAVAAERGFSRADVAALREYRYADAPDEELWAGYGPSGATIARFSEDDLPDRAALDRPSSQYGVFRPISETYWGDKQEFSPAYNGPGGKWIAPYAPHETPRYWMDLHHRIMDRSTCHYRPGGIQPSVHELPDASGHVDAERYQINPPGSQGECTFPNGHKWANKGLEDHALMQWHGLWGLAGYDVQHKGRELRAAANAWMRFPKLRPFLEDDIAAIAHDLSYWLCPYPAHHGPEGDNPHYMTRESLVYRPQQAYSTVREIGHACRAVAWAIHTGHIEFVEFGKMLYDYANGLRMKSGLTQRAGYRQIGPPTPEQLGATKDERCAAGIEIPLLEHGLFDLALVIWGEIPATSHAEAIDAIARKWLGWWSEGDEPRWPKYMVTEQRVDGEWRELTLDQVYPRSKGGADIFNGWLILEIGARYGSETTRELIRARHKEIESAWKAEPATRSMMAGLVGLIRSA